MIPLIGSMFRSIVILTTMMVMVSLLLLMMTQSIDSKRIVPISSSSSSSSSLKMIGRKNARSASITMSAEDRNSNENDDDNGMDGAEVTRMKQIRRSEVSKALALLKKHSIIGGDAKIVLRNSGKHLLVDPEQKLRLVVNHLAKMSTRSTKTSSSPDNEEGENREEGKMRAKKSESDRMKRKPNTIDLEKPNVMAKEGKKKIPKKEKVGAKTSTKSIKSNKNNNKQNGDKIGDNQNDPLPNADTIQKLLMENIATKTPTIVDSLMADKMLNEIVGMIETIVRNKRAQNLTDLSDSITELLNEQYGPHWHTIVVANPKPSFNDIDQDDDDDDGRDSNSVRAKKKKDPKRVDGINLLRSNRLLNFLQHVAIDDHHKSDIFYATIDFGNLLRVFIFK